MQHHLRHRDDRPDMIEIAGDVVRADRRTLWFRPTYPRGSVAVPLPRKWCFWLPGWGWCDA